jgi:hypothetical protein
MMSRESQVTKNWFLGEDVQLKGKLLFLYPHTLLMWVFYA